MFLFLMYRLTHFIFFFCFKDRFSGVLRSNYQVILVITVHAFTFNVQIINVLNTDKV